MSNNSMIALIPARAGSKRLPGKNLRELGGHPLLAYTINLALQICGEKNVYVSTEDTLTAEISRNYGANVPSLRPIEFAQDDSKDIEWILSALQNFDIVNSNILLLRPTSPLRMVDTVRNAIQIYEDANVDSLRSVRRVKEHPGKMWQKKGALISPFLRQPEFGENSHSSPTQSLQELWVQDASLEITNSERLKRELRLSGDLVCPFEMPGHEGFDINTADDWLLLTSLVQGNPTLLPKIERNES